MSKEVFIDADIILDLLCQRKPFYDAAAEVFTLGDTQKIVIFTTPLVFANVFYILRKTVGISRAKALLQKLRLIVHILPIDMKTIDLALQSNFSDFEDGIQYFAARSQQIPHLLTRNTKDYKVKDICVQTPAEYLKHR
jgi:predicted nucleic acid-binding protein